MSGYRGYGISKESYSKNVSNNFIIPIGDHETSKLQSKASFQYDRTDDKVYYSDGTKWLKITSSVSGYPICIQDTAGGTSVCTDTHPIESNSNIIYFRSSGILRNIIDSNGVFISTGGLVDPLSITPSPGKIAHFEGDIDVTGMIDPQGIQFTQQASMPGTTNIPNKGMVYVSSASTGDFTNSLIFVDNSDTSHVIGDAIAPSSSVDNALVRFDGTTGKFIQSSGIIIGDDDSINNVQYINNIGGDITIQSNNLIINSVLQSNGSLFNEQISNPYSLTQTSTQGVVYVKDGNYGNYINNHPMFVDGSLLEHELGDTIAPASSTDNAIVRFDGSTGKFIQNSGVILDDANKLTNVTEIEAVGSDLVLRTSGLYSVIITGNLQIQGTTTSVNSTIVNVDDNALYLNNGYITPAAREGGVVVNYLPTATTTNVALGGFTPGVASVSNPTVNVSSNIFSPGDIVQVSGANNPTNDGLFEVLSNAGGLLTIKGVGITPTTHDFFQNQFISDATVSGIITKVNVMYFGVSTIGTFITIEGSNTSTTVTGSLINTVQSSGAGIVQLINNSPQYGPVITVKDISPGTNISTTQNSNTVTIGISGIIAVANGGTAINTYSTGDILYASAANTLSKLSVGTNGQVLTLTAGIPSWTSSSASDVVLSSAGGTESLVNDGAGPALVVKGLTPGAGISLTDTGTAIQITNSSLNTSVALSSAGGTASLVNDGAGPLLAVKGLTAGAGISFNDTGTEIEITNTSLNIFVSLSTIGGASSLVYDGTGPILSLKGITPGAGISFNDTGTEIQIINSSLNTNVVLTSAGGTDSLVQDGSGPSLAVKGLTAGVGMSIADGGISLTLTNTAPDQIVSLGAGAGISITGTYPNFTITNTLGSGSLASGGGTSLINDGTGPDFEIKGISVQDDLSLTVSPGALTIGRRVGYGMIEKSDYTQFNASWDLNGYPWFYDSTFIGGINFDQSGNGRLRYTGSTSGVIVAIHWRAQGDFGANTTAYVGLMKNLNTVIPGSVTRFFENDNGDSSTLSGFGITTMNTNDYIRICGINPFTPVDNPYTTPLFDAAIHAFLIG